MYSIGEQHFTSMFTVLLCQSVIIKVLYIVETMRATHRLDHLEFCVAYKGRGSVGGAGVNCHNIEAVLQSKGCAQVPSPAAKVHQPPHTKPLFNM